MLWNNKKSAVSELIDISKLAYLKELINIDKLN